MKIRPTRPEDIPSLQRVLQETGLFPPEMLPEMIEGFFSDADPSDLWLTCEQDETPVGLCYAAPEELADGTWNMLALAVLPVSQGKGCGAAIVTHLEETLRARGQRILIADTSGTESFARTRAFYARRGYEEEARIRDFWAPGDDKVTFRKALT
ncbi:GNAT family N-acetyltransferase [Ruegeria jejuensis]|uniref:GNAT family N-acetyltransferase n=1 Tax=Ruegeria jejuensis TaxID=3233338 RepID=UPI00355C1178